MAGLMALAATGFLSMVSEVLPAGVLPQISADLGISDSLAGQTVSICAFGAVVSAIPLSALTARMRRRPVLLAAIAGFSLVNLLAALAESYALLLAARFCAGLCAGLLWALLAPYASRMAPEHLAGRAIGLAMLGEPLALLIGVPGGTLIGTTIGWRSAFLLISLLGVGLIGWVLWSVPDFPARAETRLPNLVQVLKIPGVAAVLAVTLTLVLAQDTLYVYIAPFLVPSGLAARTDLVLFLDGAAATIGIWITTFLVDRHLRLLTLLSILGFLSAATLLGLFGSNAVLVLLGIGVIGLVYGGLSTLLQTAVGRAAGSHVDVAQAMLVTAWMGAIAGGGVLGGILLDNFGVGSLPWALAVMAVPSFALVWAGKDGFGKGPAGRD